jgi:hypothetical protein
MALALSSCHITAPRGNDGWNPVMLALNVDDAPEVRVAAVNCERFSAVLVIIRLTQQPDIPNALFAVCIDVDLLHRLCFRRPRR